MPAPIRTHVNPAHDFAAADALFSGVIRLMAPFWSSSPQRPQLRRSVYHESTSAWVGIRWSDCPAAVEPANAFALVIYGIGTAMFYASWYALLSPIVLEAFRGRGPRPRR